MKLRMLLLLLTALFLMLSGCTPVLESQLESKPSTGGEVTLTTSTPEPSNDVPKSESTNDIDYDEFQTFLETWKLSGLIPEGLTLTAEHRKEFIKYFVQFDDDTFNYVILLLHGIITGTITVTDDYNDYENGVYLNGCQLCLFDMNGDDVPELILKTGVCEADYWYTVYTIVDGELIACGGISGGHSSLLIDGPGSFIRYEAQMGCYDITLSTLEGTTLITQEIANGELNYDKGEDYPKLEEYGYGDYNQWLEFSGIPTLILAPAG